ncbi:MAG TPA: choice-of-anchor N protein [Candidatus Hypogeohydataceae bacterium YC41]
MFQTYIEGATAGTIGQDEDTWFHSGTPFTLDVVGAFGPKTTSLTGVTLAISIPEGQTGTISLTPLGGAAVPILLTTLGQSIPGVNPAANADEHILTNVVGNNGYDTKSFAPATFNNHYPFKDGVSDFLIYDLSPFTNTTTGLNNYDATPPGSITFDAIATGQQKQYTVSFTGFPQVHFDVYGFETKSVGTNSWQINPGSHDSTANAAVPETSSVLLLGMGLVGLGYHIRQRKVLPVC